MFLKISYKILYKYYTELLADPFPMTVSEIKESIKKDLYYKYTYGAITNKEYMQLTEEFVI